ncbi:uncharacterized protein [Henckelia pumila]|uniref:uncharacterized protein n=1 Tax=Henckelia pumila TaxID=405737 RepID=UPI003C6DC970
MYIKLETTRLDYYRNNQDELRSEYYQGIVDSINCGENRGSRVGQRIVLPASFIGGPRDMHKRYLDAMALVWRFGKPDLFITMTCNPEWKEIKENLKGNQQAQDRMDLTSRVFRAKVQDLKKEITQKAVFGEVCAYFYVVEFQKRGLPHIHMLIILKKEHKINSTDQFDDYVSAELPEEEKNPRLFNVVVKHMMHGPCGHLNKTNSCMVRGQCKSHYPQKFCERTVQGKDGYPIYRRRNDSQTVDVRRAKLNNQWVVPYNPYLLMRYDCHMNVEICSGLTAVKYLYKYIYKGHDKVAVHIASGSEVGTVDEIKKFQDARWVSAQEALWRIFEFELNEISPAVINLALHLPNKHCVTFWRNQNLDYVLRQEHNSKTMLTEFFYTCSVNAKARTLLYVEFPEYYVWDNQTKSWYERKKRRVIGRVNAANLVEGERYYLRLLLSHVRGPISFDYLLMVNGKRYFTFKESAQKRGLLESDRSNFECMNEVVTFQMPNSLRRLFATILVYCEPADVRFLWDTYFEAMSEDLQRQFHQNREFLVSKKLQSINLILESMGKQIGAFDLPQISLYMRQSNGTFSREIEEEKSIQISDDDYCANSRTGKTFLYRALLANIRKKNMIALATATSGVAASILPGGRTSHSRFKIPIDLHEESYCSISKQSGLAELLRQTNFKKESIAIKESSVDCEQQKIKRKRGRPMKVPIIDNIAIQVKEEDNNTRINIGDEEVIATFTRNDSHLKQNERKRGRPKKESSKSKHIELQIIDADNTKIIGIEDDENIASLMKNKKRMTKDKSLKEKQVRNIKKENI